jgi:hypothetical protein
MYKVTYKNGWVSYYDKRPSNYAPEMLWSLSWRLYEWSKFGYWMQIDGQI